MPSRIVELRPFGEVGAFARSSGPWSNLNYNRLGGHSYSCWQKGRSSAATASLVSLEKGEWGPSSKRSIRRSAELLRSKCYTQFAPEPTVCHPLPKRSGRYNAIDHPGVVEIYEFNRLPDGTTFIVMEFLAGESLAKRLQNGPLGLDTLRIARQIASVLAAAHDKNIVHRDLKPDNVIMVKDPEAPGGERAKVLDFGIAAGGGAEPQDAEANSSRNASVYGTRAGRGASGVTAESDVYAPGSAMYEMLAGQLPFQGEGLGDIMMKHLTEEPPLRQRQPGGSGTDCRAGAHRMLSKKPDDRPAMREVIAETERLGAQRTGVMSAFGEPPPLGNSRPATLALDPPPGGTPQTLALSDSPPKTKTTTTTVSAGQQGTSIPKPALFAGIAGLVLLIGVGGFLSGRKRRPPVVPQSSSMRVRTDRRQTNPQTTLEVRKPSPVPVPQGMAYIPGGRFSLGSTDGDIDLAFKLCQKRGTNCRRDVFERETPQHAVVVRNLFLDETEITTEQFVSWLSTQKATQGRQKEADLARKDTPSVRGRFEWGLCLWKEADVCHARRFSKSQFRRCRGTAAKQFCEAQGKRLPTEAEWELAARGLVQRTFPWGDNHPKCAEVAFARDPELPPSARCRNLESTADPVGRAVQDRTVDGVSDLGGNVSEWTSDLFMEHYAPCAGACKDPQVSGEPLASAGKGKRAKKGTPILRAVRGGHFNQSMDGCRSAGRNRFAEETLLPSIGFRCAKSLP